MPTPSSTPTSLDIQLTKDMAKVRHPTTSTKYSNIEDDSDDEPGPPALSSYAMSLLEHLDIPEKKITPKPESSSKSIVDPSELIRSFELSTTKTAMSKSATKRRPRALEKHGLGAARRVDDDYPSWRRVKRPITPKTSQSTIKTGLSPVVKRNDRNRTPYRLSGNGIQTTPTKHDDGSSPELYATPERARRALTPLSEKRNTRLSLDLWGESNKENAKKPLMIDLGAVKAARDDKKKEDKPIAPPIQPSKASNIVTIHGQKFTVVEQIGKGGSSKVYRAKCSGRDGNSQSKVKYSTRRSYALKVVSLGDCDKPTMDEFKGEVSILKRLASEQRVVKMLDYSIDSNTLTFVMECGEIDLAHVLSSRSGMPYDCQFVRYHAAEILKCIAAVHSQGIVHADLKPANFLFVRGTLKLIDFGISNYVSDQTVNVYRECQMGTPNYMAPETLIETEKTIEAVDKGSDEKKQHRTVWRVGKPADIWSCGCIIYQMCYGKPPYAQYPGNKKILAITNPQLQITYPRKSPNGGPPVSCLAIDTMKRCLRRDPGKRSTADELLTTPFLDPKVVTAHFIGDLVRSAVKYGAKHPDMSDHKLQLLVHNVWKRVNEYC